MCWCKMLGKCVLYIKNMYRYVKRVVKNEAIRLL